MKITGKLAELACHVCLSVKCHLNKHQQEGKRMSGM